MSIAIAPGSFLSESGPTKEFEDEANESHENGHTHPQSDDGGDI